MRRLPSIVKLLSIFLFFCVLAVFLAGCMFPIDQVSWERMQPGYPTGITFPYSIIEVNEDFTIQLNVTVSSASPEYQEVTWQSSEPGIATIDTDGVIHPVSIGLARITAKTVYADYSASCDVRVRPAGTITGLSLEPTLTLDVIGTSWPSSATLVPVFSPLNTLNKSVTWYSENTSIATVNSAGLVSSIRPGTTRIRVTSVADTSYSAYCAVTVTMTPSPCERRFSLDIGQLVAAEYSRALERIVVVSSADNRLILINPVNGNFESASLPQVPLSLGLSPDGLKAVVGYTNFVGTIDLVTGSPVVTSTWPVTPYTGISVNRGSITSIMIDPLGYIYGIDSADQWIDLRQIDSSTGAEALKLIQLLRAGGQGRVHQSGTSIYCILFPSYWFGRIDISNPAVTSFPYYYKTEYDVYSFWFFDSGNAAVVSTGKVFSITQLQSTDLALLGSITVPFEGNRLKWADHNSLAVHDSVTGLIAIIVWPYTSIYDRNVFLVDASTYIVLSSYVLPDFLINETSYPGHGKFCFWNSDGTELYVLMQSTGAPDPDLIDLVVY